ncbi:MULTISPECIES: NUDIX hydrolase [unclassified Nocardioides]|uniref:NUDIX domain-containing protein n=1 Tax=unclassified Nocardioides TaxID=2615069 RepID=UPI001171F1E9|nr:MULTISPECIES: NUDIX hydrolase [unclassified Nocardioides]TQK71964.1 NUDIX domain-containing protein [Nocardioides sp. SLBN-35]WGY03849.1 NUDIX hydrolase [Nocardioides sp. QY071]
MPESEISHATVDDGVARLTWTSDLTERGWQAAVDVVRRQVAEALTDHERVEVKVAIDDAEAQRIATWSGMRREGVQRGRAGDVVVYARLVDDVPVHEPGGFRALLNSFLPRKRGIGQMLVRDCDGSDGSEPRVLMCNLTYKTDWDLPGGVVEVGESPRVAVAREVEEELDLTIDAGALLLTDWLPPWGGWDDALCLVFDGGVHPASIVQQVVPQPREIKTADFLTLAEIDERAADFTARRVRAALASLAGTGPAYTESGR